MLKNHSIMNTEPFKSNRLMYTLHTGMFYVTSIAEEGLCKTVCCSFTTCMMGKMALCKILT